MNDGRETLKQRVKKAPQTGSEKEYIKSILQCECSLDCETAENIAKKLSDKLIKRIEIEILQIDNTVLNNTTENMVSVLQSDTSQVA